MPSSPPKQRLTDRKRAAILDAAVAEFQKRGFDGTSMDQIAETAGASKRTVYNHFKSKDELFHAIITEVSGQFDEIPEIPYQPDQDLDTQLVKIGQAIAATTMSEEFINLVRVVISRFIQAPEIAAETMKEQDSHHKGLVRWIRSATRDGRLNPSDPETAADEFVALIKAFAFWPQLIRSSPMLSTQKRNAVIRSAARMFLSRYQY